MNPQNGWGSARDASPGTPLWCGCKSGSMDCVNPMMSEL